MIITVSPWKHKQLMLKSLICVSGVFFTQVAISKTLHDVCVFCTFLVGQWKKLSNFVLI